LSSCTFKDTKVAFLQQECRLQFQTQGVADYYSNFLDVQIGLNKVASNIDLFYEALPFLFIGCVIFDNYLTLYYLILYYKVLNNKIFKT